MEMRREERRENEDEKRGRTEMRRMEERKREGR